MNTYLYTNKPQRDILVAVCNIPLKYETGGLVVNFLNYIKCKKVQQKKYILYFQKHLFSELEGDEV